MNAGVEPLPERPKHRPLGGAALVAIGILSSRVVGIVRDMLRAAFFGATGTPVGDAWTMAIRIPNLLQNLLGEGVLSAAFIPVYTRLLAEGGPKFELTVHLTRILFPGTALFVLAAWCIGVLNSRRRFLLPYMAPVMWNLTMVAAFLWCGPRLKVVPLAIVVSWASVLGAALQFFVQVPTVLSLAKHLRVRLDYRREKVRLVVRNFVPVALSRGVVQISQFVDLWIANLLPQGSATLLMTAQTVNLLPISVFGMAVSVSELPEMSSVVGTEDERAVLLRERIAGAVRRIAFFVIPSAVAFILFGDVIIRVLYERRLWKSVDTMYAWGILAGSAFGLLASTIGRLYSAAFYAMHDTRRPLNFAVIRVTLTVVSAAFYAMHDTRRPLNFAVIRVTLTVVLGYLAAVPLTNALGIDKHWGPAGLTLTAGIAGWVEFALLRRELQRRVGSVSLPIGFMVRLWAIAASAATVGYGVQRLVEPLFSGMRPSLRNVVSATAILGAYGLCYLAVAATMKIPEATALTQRFRRR